MVDSFEQLGAWAGAYSTGSLKTTADQQISAAARGDRLTSLRSETHPSAFWTGAAADDRAFLQSAYWLAVGSRLLTAKGDRGGAAQLLPQARAAYRSGAAAYYLPGTDEDPLKIRAITSGYAGYLTRAGLPEVAAILTQSGTRQASQRAADLLSQRSAAGVIKGMLTESAADIAQIAQTGRGVVTGERPTGASPLGWWLKKNGLRLAVGIGVVVVAGYVFRPYLQAWNARRGGEDG